MRVNRALNAVYLAGTLVLMGLLVSGGVISSIDASFDLHGYAPIFSAIGALVLLVPLSLLVSPHWYCDRPSDPAWYSTSSSAS